MQDGKYHVCIEVAKVGSDVLVQFDAANIGIVIFQGLDHPFCRTARNIRFSGMAAIDDGYF